MKEVDFVYIDIYIDMNFSEIDTDYSYIIRLLLPNGLKNESMKKFGFVFCLLKSFP